MMDLISENIQQTIKKNKLFKKTQTLLVSFSAGPDSVCLLHNLNKLKYKKIILIYFDHQLRSSKEINTEKDYVKYYSKKIGCEYKIKKLPILKFSQKYKLSIEVVGHLLRKELLQHYCKLFKADVIVTAHHKDDYTETILLNMLRGSLFSFGLKLINSTQTYNVVRPLFNIRKQQILNYCNTNKLKVSIDSSNYDNQFKRNFVRNKFIPLINNNSTEFFKVLEEVNDFWTNKLSEKVLLNKSKYIILIKKSFFYECDLTKVLTSSSFELNRWISQLLYKIYELNFHQGKLRSIFLKNIDITSYHIHKISMVFQKKSSGKIVMLPKNINVLRHRNSLFFYEEKKIQYKYECIKEIELNKKTYFDHVKIEYNRLKTKPKSFLSTKSKCYINRSISKLSIRYINKNDRFIPFSKRKSVNLWQYLSKKKLNMLQKMSTLVICDKNQIVWVVGICIDDRYKVLSGDDYLSELKIQPLTNTNEHMISYY